MCHMSGVMCHVPGVTCYVSGSRYHMSDIYITFFFTKGWGLKVQELLSTGPTHLVLISFEIRNVQNICNIIYFMTECAIILLFVLEGTIKPEEM